MFAKLFPTELVECASLPGEGVGHGGNVKGLTALLDSEQVFV